MPVIPVRTPPTIRPAAKAEGAAPVQAPKIVKAPKAAPKSVKVAAPAPAPKAVKAAPKPAPKVVKAPVKVPAKTEKVEKAAKGGRPATENVIPKVETVKSRHWGEEAIVLARLLIALKAAQTAIQGSGRVEIRSVSPFLQNYLNGKFGMNCHKVYVKPEDVEKFVKVVQSIPEVLLPVKWVRALAKMTAAQA